MVVEYFSLKKKVHEMEEEKFEQAVKGGKVGGRAHSKISNVSNELLLIKKAKEKVEGGNYEMEDCGMLMENMVRLVAKKKLRGDMVELGLICELVRRCASSSEDEGEEEESHPTPEIVATFFKNSKKEEVVEFLSGVKV